PRPYGVLRLPGVTPPRRSRLPAARALAVLPVILVQHTVVGRVGAGPGWPPARSGLPARRRSPQLGAGTALALRPVPRGPVRAHRGRPEQPRAGAKLARALVRPKQPPDCGASQAEWDR